MTKKETKSSKSIPTGPNYQLYSNERYGYTMEYPKKWEIKWNWENDTPEQEGSPNQVLHFGVQNEETIFLAAWDNKENLSLVDWCGQQEGCGSILHATSSIPNARIAGEDAFALVQAGEQSFPRINILFSHEKEIFWLEKTIPTPNPSLTTFLHILRTFEFDGQVTQDQIPDLASQLK